jgi:DNA-binding transcriptional LysR family regulator
LTSVPFTLRQLEYLDASASEGSLAAAAVRCQVSASALALAIDDLERRLGVQLLVRRKGKGVLVTPAGSRVLSRARQVLVGAEALASEAWQAGRGLTGTFTIGCFSTLSPFYLPGVMQAFGHDHPGLDLSFVEASALELHELLGQGRLDVALLYSVDVSPQLGFDAIDQYRPHVVVAADHPLAGRESVRLAELAGDPLIVLDVHPTRRNTEQIFAALSLTPHPAYTTTSFELARCLVGRGLGYAVLFQRPESGMTYDGHRVTIVEIADALPPTVVGLARPPGAPRTARLEALREFLASRPEHASAPAVS